MNTLVVGSEKRTLLDFLPDHFLLIDDGELIEQIEFPKRRAVTFFDVSKHSFNPVKNIDYRRAREFITVLDAVFPEGENTLTRKNSNFILLNALLAKPKSLETLVSQPSKTDGAQTDAYQKVATLLLSSVLNNILNRPTNLSFTGTIVARLNRAELGDFDCFVIANLLISQYKGPVVIPDFGFYSHKAHSSLIRQGRLVAGINSFSEVPKLAQLLLTIDQKLASHCTTDDAKVLAQYQGLLPATNAYNQFIDTCISYPERGS